MTLTKERVRETLRVLSERRDHVESRLMDVRNRGRSGRWRRPA
jgi:hypothetical protein